MQKITRKKTYEIKWVYFPDGSSQLDRRNEGFDAFELLGILEQAQMEIIEQLRGKIKPDVIKRTVIR